MGKGSGKFVVGALIGAAAGAALGLLFAPKSGKETRKAIAEKAKDYSEKGKKLVAKEAKSAGDAVSDIKDKILK